jgi:hypothetical protein
LETLLNISKRTHADLAEFLELEPFQNMLIEIDQCIRASEFNGRIITHVIDEIIRDLIPSYCFNNVTKRFCKGSVFYAEPVQRPRMSNPKPMYTYGSKALNIEFTLKFLNFKEFIGEIHFKSLFNVVGATGLMVILLELSRHVGIMVRKK